MPARAGFSRNQLLAFWAGPAQSCQRGQPPQRAAAARRRAEGLSKKRRNCAKQMSANGSGQFSSMDWFRSRSRSWARLMLLALVTQVAISFGHMHRHDVGLPPLAPAHRTHVTSDATDAPVASSDRDHCPASNNPCSICASIALLATGAPSLPPVTRMPAPVRHVWPAPAPVQVVATQVALSFQARAPPIV
jgi:hypothetical protein